MVVDCATAAAVEMGFFFLSEPLRAVDASSIFFCNAQNWSAADVEVAGATTEVLRFAAFAAIA